MKRYAFLRLENNANTVIAEYGPCDFEQALAKFRAFSPQTKLDDSGYCKFTDTVSFCMAEFHDQYCELP